MPIWPRAVTSPPISAPPCRSWGCGGCHQHHAYQANLRNYQLLRYGVPVQVAAGQSHETVQLIDWAQPERNHFALAEEIRADSCWFSTTALHLVAAIQQSLDMLAFQR